MAITQNKIDKIVDQALNEIDFARTYKQGKISNWQKNEAMYYGRKITNTESRANVSLGRMQEFVHTLLSKIDNPLTFKFVKRKNSQMQRVELLNALRRIDQVNDGWDMKDIVGKKQGIIYGRAVYCYYADSVDNIYKPHLENIDVYNFLVDPACGGLDLERARYLGDFSVELDKRQLREGVKNKIYIKSAVDLLINDGSGNADGSSQEEMNKRQRSYDQNTIGQKEISDPTKYKFWRWCTTYQEDGERYYLLMDNSGNCIRCEKLTENFPATKMFPLGPWPYWSWAAFPDLTEFWTPSCCDYARELFMAQDVSVNQMLDNAEAINKPQKIVDVTAIENLAELKYRRDGIIKSKGGIDVNRAVQFVRPPSIDTPIRVFELLEGIQEKASGVTSGSKGVSDEDGKVGIYEGNQAAVADRLGLLNKSYAAAYMVFARLYELGIRQHLTKKVAVDVVGPQGVEIHEVSKRDIFKRNDEYSVLVEASNAQAVSSAQESVAKINFLSAESENPLVNQKKSFEIRAKIAGYTEEEIEELLDTSFYGNSELMAECDRDIETLLEDEKIRPNQAANNAYKQRMVDYMRDHEEDITMEQFTRIADYVTLLDPIIMRNEARALQSEVVQMMNTKTGLVPEQKGETIVEETVSPEANQLSII